MNVARATDKYIISGFYRFWLYFDTYLLAYLQENTGMTNEGLLRGPCADGGELG